MGRERKLRRAGLLNNQPKVEEKAEPKVEPKVEVKPEPTAAPVVEVESTPEPEAPATTKKSLLSKLLPSEEE